MNMPLPLHDHFSWTKVARQQIDLVTQRYRNAGHDPQVLSIAKGTCFPKQGKPFDLLIIGYYCAPESDQIPDEEIGIIDGLPFVFAASDQVRPQFWNKILDWNAEKGWFLIDSPRNSEKLHDAARMTTTPHPRIAPRPSGVEIVPGPIENSRKTFETYSGDVHGRPMNDN